MKEKDPVEQQRIKIDSLKEQTKGNLGRLFDNREELGDKIDQFILQLEIFERSGLVFNKEQIIQGVRESVNIHDRETFIAHLLRILEPIIILKVTQSKIFEKVDREATINNSGNLRLSEVLYVSFEDETARIHLAPAIEFIKEVGMGNFRKEITALYIWN